MSKGQDKNLPFSRSKKLPLDYIVVGILSNLPEDIKTIPTAKPFLHSFFFQRRDKYKILSKIPFETTYYPYSEDLEQAFDNLELSSMVCKFNPVLQTYHLKEPELKNFFKVEIESKAGKHKIEEIKKLAQEFAGYIKQPM